MYSQINPGYGRPNSMSYNAMNHFAGSELESMVSQYAIEGRSAIEEAIFYQGTGKSSYRSYDAIAEEQPVVFLNPQRPNAQFVGHASELTEHIKEAFFLTTGATLPQDVEITIDSRERLSQKNPAFLNASVAGLSMSGSREVFVASGKLDEVMLTVGHEIGHVIKPRARTAEEEEAKAFAFEAAWARAIFENDVAGLRSSIDSSALKPAENGLHDVAFNFVKNNSETDPLELFEDLSVGNVSRQQVFEGERIQPAAAAKVKSFPAYSSPQRNKIKLYGGYQNKSRVMNLPPPHNFFWADLGKGIYGMYVPMTAVETLNQALLRKDVEQMHKTMGHEYSLHHVMRLPDGYVVEALEDAMFWTGDDDRYKL